MNPGVRTDMVPSLSMKAPSRSLAHDRLRSSTSDLHSLVENGLDLTSISGTPGYLAFLLSNWPFASIEVALESAGIHHVLLDWDKRRRREALAMDLGQFGIPPPAIGPLEIGSDLGTLLGWSYVIEGSRLGAGMILRAITRNGEQVAHGTLFLHRGADENLWSTFKVALSRIDEDSSAISNACAAAISAFDYFLAARAPVLVESLS
jgi:heme oxygenase (biliverdin-IX-beta and delta-forming)